METSELIKKVRKIEIKTKGLSQHLFSGAYHTAFKGRGMSFAEVRDYHFGDDVRNIDWNVTARYNEPFVKVFEEERELTVMLLVDVSQSAFFGSVAQFKTEILTEIAAVLAFSAVNNHDKVGVILFSNTVEKYIPPKKGKSHTLRIIRELVNFEPTGKATDLSQALQYFNNVQKKRSISFILSDFLTPDYEQALRIVAQRHDLIGIHLFDPREKNLPNVGLIRMKDAETGEIRLVDTSNEPTRAAYRQFFDDKQNRLNQLFKRSGADVLHLEIPSLLAASPHNDPFYVKELLQFFKKRR